MVNGDELDVLRQIGAGWAPAFPRGPLDPGVDPSISREQGVPEPSRFGRLTSVQMFRPETPGELQATEEAGVPRAGAGRTLAGLRRVIIGPPLRSAAIVQERMRKLVALPVLSSDLLSSVAYGPEAMLTVLALAGTAALGLSLPIGAGLVILMAAVGISYRQTIPAYPHGAGSYIVASDNLGRTTGLTAAAGLMLDYILTVAVSVTSGVEAVTSALPGLRPLTVPAGLAVIGVLLAGNLRGIRTAGNIFAAPTYIFLAAIGLLIVAGLVDAGRRGFAPIPPPASHATEAVGLLLILRAFSSGATSMTGIEAVSNAIPAFRQPEWRNARTVLTWMVCILIVSFGGLVLLFHLNGIAPSTTETTLSQLAHRVFRSGPLYYVVQAATALILLLAANTAYNDFPRLLCFMARDSYAPRQFQHLGDRLAFRNGLLALSVPAAVLLIAFRGYTQALIPLYAVGVFLAFTLSQSGMVVHWRRHRGTHWRKKATINAVGAVLSALVLLTAAVTKFIAGAWVVVLMVPLLIVFFRRVRRHYDTVHAALAPRTLPEAPRPRRDGTREGVETPQATRNVFVVPVARLDLAALRALAYAASLGQPGFAVHVTTDEQGADLIRRHWEAWGDHLRLEIIISPYRATIAPLIHYLEALRVQRPDLTLTVVVPEIVVRRRWHNLLHSHTGQRLRAALHRLPGVVVANVPVHLDSGAR
jgi:amino acid transporter